VELIDRRAPPADNGISTAAPGGSRTTRQRETSPPSSQPHRRERTAIASASSSTTSAATSSDACSIAAAHTISSSKRHADAADGCASCIQTALTPVIAGAAMPNVSLTPGAVADTDPRIVCAFGYASAHRDVPYAERDAIYREYGFPRVTRYASPRRGYRIDHLVPLELGGANDPRNLSAELAALASKSLPVRLSCPEMTVRELWMT
jgi:hypothetical protein